jgi:hypothetical protein
MRASSKGHKPATALHLPIRAEISRIVRLATIDGHFGE